MKIIVAGPGHLKTVPMFQQTVETLREMGHTVEPFNLGWKHPLDRLLRRPLKKMLGRNDEFMAGMHSARVLNKKLVAMADAMRPDLLFSIFGFDLDGAALKAINGLGVKTACWWLNDPFHLERSYKQAAWYDVYFTNAPGCVPDYEKAGFTNVRGLLHACYPPWHHPVELTDAELDKYGCQIAFACDWEEIREEAILRLLDRYEIKIWGPWKKKLPADSPLRQHIVADWFAPAEMGKIAAGADIVLNLHTWFGKSDVGVNPRVIEACGCGSFQLCDWKTEIPKAFTDGQEIVLYHTLDELEEKIDYYLERPSEREKIAAAGAARAHKDHTYTQRMQQVLAAIK